jgi:hypothetical protein
MPWVVAMFAVGPQIVFLISIPVCLRDQARYSSYGVASHTVGGCMVLASPIVDNVDLMVGNVCVHCAEYSGFDNRPPRCRTGVGLGFAQ